MKLDLSSLRKAVKSLEKTIRVADDDAFMSRLDEETGRKGGSYPELRIHLRIVLEVYEAMAWSESWLGLCGGCEPAAVVQAERRTPIGRRC